MTKTVRATIGTANVPRHVVRLLWIGTLLAIALPIGLAVGRPVYEALVAAPPSAQLLSVALTLAAAAGLAWYVDRGRRR